MRQLVTPLFRPVWSVSETIQQSLYVSKWWIGWALYFGSNAFWFVWFLSVDNPAVSLMLHLFGITLYIVVLPVLPFLWKAAVTDHEDGVARNYEMATVESLAVVVVALAPFTIGSLLLSRSDGLDAILKLLDYTSWALAWIVWCGPQAKYDRADVRSMVDAQP